MRGVISDASSELGLLSLCSALAYTFNPYIVSLDSGKTILLEQESSTNYDDQSNFMYYFLFIDVVLVFLLLTLNTFHTFFYSFYCCFEQVNVTWVNYNFDEHDLLLH